MKTMGETPVWMPVTAMLALCTPLYLGACGGVDQATDDPAITPGSQDPAQAGTGLVFGTRRDSLFSEPDTASVYPQYRLVWTASHDTTTVTRWRSFYVTSVTRVTGVRFLDVDRDGTSDLWFDIDTGGDKGGVLLLAASANSAVATNASASARN